MAGCAEAGQELNGAATQGRAQVDLEDLTFKGEGHFMSNRKVNLPQGSQRNSFKVTAHALPSQMSVRQSHSCFDCLTKRSGQQSTSSCFVELHCSRQPAICPLSESVG